MSDDILDWAPRPASLPVSVWPAVLPPKVAQKRWLLQRLQRSQWLPPEEVASGQLEQLSRLLRFAYAKVPFYRERLGAAGVDPSQDLTAADLSRIPVLDRADLQAGRCNATPPKQHGSVTMNRTSGSSGMPVEVHVTDLYHLFYECNAARDNHWAGRDPAWTSAIIRRTGEEPPAGGREGSGWALGPAWCRDDPSRTVIQSIRLTVGEQLDWLLELRPEVVVSYPSNLVAVAQRLQERGARIANQRQVVTIGEMLTPTAREIIGSGFGVPVVDIYSSEELGMIASPCPDGDGYHVHAESVLVEVLDDVGEPCEPGETGRLVISALQNFATPLIRYDIRDWAEQGGPCSCGRGLPVIRRILGRSRNMLVLPDGERRWPLTGYMRFGEVIPVRQFQFAQTSRERVQARLVADRPATPEDEAALARIIQDELGHPFEIEFVWLDELPTSPGGKFEEFVSELG